MNDASKAPLRSTSWIGRPMIRSRSCPMNWNAARLARRMRPSEQSKTSPSDAPSTMASSSSESSESPPPDDQGCSGRSKPFNFSEMSSKSPISKGSPYAQGVPIGSRSVVGRDQERLGAAAEPDCRVRRCRLGSLKRLNERTIDPMPPSCETRPSSDQTLGSPDVFLKSESATEHDSDLQNYAQWCKVCAQQGDNCRRSALLPQHKRPRRA